MSAMMNTNAMLAWRALMARLAKSQAGQFAAGAGSMLLPSAEQIRDIPEGLSYLARHPIDSAKLLGGGMQDASQDQFEKMFLAPTLSEKIGHGAAGAIPVVGPAAAMAGEEIGAGNTAKGLGMAAGLLAPSAYMGIKPMIKEAVMLRAALKRAANIARIRQDGAGSFANLTPEQAAGAREALANSIEPPSTSGREGSLAQLRDDPNVSVPGMTDLYATRTTQPEPVLPSRRDALKVGGATTIAAALAPRLMETVAKAPEAAVPPVPPRGLAAPSALGREGFYRELKYRVQDELDTETPPSKVVSSPDDLYVSRPKMGMEDVSRNLNPGDRLFMTRVVDSGNTYTKDVHMVPRGANLREALRRKLNEMATGNPDIINEGDPYIKVVHSEITPEAALRLNTIEKPKVPHASSLPDNFNGPVQHFKLVDPDGVTQSTVSIPVGKRGNPIKKYMDRVYRDMDRHVELQPNRNLMDLEPITPEEFKAITNDSWRNIEGYNEPPNRPVTVGISPRYAKRVSIRLLKDTLEKQIKENKRAAGKIPPLLAKPAVLQDNPLLTRQDFFAGLRKKK